MKKTNALLFGLDGEKALAEYVQTLSMQFSTTGGSFRAFLVRTVCLLPQLTFF